MDDATKRVWDVVLQILAMVGAAVAFWVGLRQWRRGQEWQRAEQIDKFILQFETDELLRLATSIIDWTRRTVSFREKEFTITNTDSLMALRVHTELDGNFRFEGEQAILRDAYDALLAFFARLELALTTGLIDVEPARKYFTYWLEHFLSFDKHPPDPRSVEEWIQSLEQRHLLGQQVESDDLRNKAELIHSFMATANPPALVAKYVGAYGDPVSIQRLCQKFAIEVSTNGRQAAEFSAAEKQDG